jgi:predicted dehydrogenase
MPDYSIAFVGTGQPPESPDATGFAMAYKHAESYSRLDDCTLEACADIVRENATEFAESVGIEAANVYEDYREMLSAVEPDIVSVCVPPAAHAEITTGCIETGIPAAVHCEKPMADSWDDCRQMVAAAEEHGVQLSFNHQRRFGTPFQKAKELLDNGEIGALTRVEFAAPNLFDYGTHSFDLSNYFTDEAAPEWVIGQVDYREENVLFGSHNENQAIVQWQYENGVHGLATTGIATGAGGVACHNRLVGSEGVIEVGVGFATERDGPMLRVRRDGGSGWEVHETNDEDVHGRRDAGGWKGQTVLTRALADVVESIGDDAAPQLSGENALRATELIFGAWESARRSGRVDLPLEIDDNPLAAMVESGQLRPSDTDL